MCRNRKFSVTMSQQTTDLPGRRLGVVIWSGGSEGRKLSRFRPPGDLYPTSGRSVVCWGGGIRGYVDMFHAACSVIDL